MMMKAKKFDRLAKATTLKKDALETTENISSIEKDDTMTMIFAGGASQEIKYNGKSHKIGDEISLPKEKFDTLMKHGHKFTSK